MAAVKRMGRPDSDMREVLLNVAVRVIREEGAGAATSRRIAETAGVAQQLVYYYFKNMDEVLLATFERQANQALERAEAALEHARSGEAPSALGDIWRELTTTIDAKFNFEFMSLCNRNDLFREKMAHFLNRWRKLQAEAIAEEWKRGQIDLGHLTPSAAAFLIYSARLVLIREESMGVTEGHDDAKAAIDWFLGHMDALSPPPYQ